MLPQIKILNRFRYWLAYRILGSLPLELQPAELSLLTPAQLEEAQALFSMPKFFIFGYPRSGTTLLMRLISLHPQVHCNREAHFFTHAGDPTGFIPDSKSQQWLERKSNRWTYGQHLETPLVRLIADFIMEREARQLGKTIVGDKTPNANAGQAVQYMHSIYPDARLIFIVRDGRDAALSHRFQHFIDQPNFLNREDQHIRQDLIRNSSHFFEKKKSVFTQSVIDNEACSWAKNVSETHDLGQKLFRDRYIWLRYEDLLGSPGEHISQLWTFLGVDPEFPDMESQVKTKLAYNPGAEAQLEKEGELVRNLQRGTKGNWREIFTLRDRQVFKALAGKALVDWNYEKDLNW